MRGQGGELPARAATDTGSYRASLVQHLRSSTEDLRWALESLPGTWVTREPAPGEWSVHKAISHLRDVEIRAYAPRLRRALAENEPLFPDFDGLAWLAANYRPQERIEDIFNEFAQQRLEEIAILTGLDGGQWERAGSHEAGGRMTVEYLAERMYWHTLEHITQVFGNRQVFGLEG